MRKLNVPVSNLSYVINVSAKMKNDAVKIIQKYMNEIQNQSAYKTIKIDSITTEPNKELVMAGTKGKKQKGTIIDRTVRRLERMRAYSNMHKRLARWVTDETSEVAKAKVEGLRDQLQGAAALHTTILETFKALQIGKYIPPKRHVTGTIKLDPGKHVWIKEKYKEVYAKTYDDVVLNDLYVSDTVAKKVVLSIGDPTQNPGAMKFIVAKNILQANDPNQIESAAA